MNDIIGTYVEHSIYGIGCVCETYVKNNNDFVVVEFADGSKRAFPESVFLSHFKIEEDTEMESHLLEKTVSPTAETSKDKIADEPDKGEEILKEVTAWLRNNKNYTVFSEKKGRVAFALNIDDSSYTQGEVINKGELSLLPGSNCVHFEYRLIQENRIIPEIYYEDSYSVLDYYMFYDLITILDKKTRYNFFPNDEDNEHVGIEIKKNLFSLEDFLKIEEILYTFCTTDSCLYPTFKVQELPHHDIGYKDFVIIANVFLCIKEHHTMERVLAFIEEVLPDGTKEKVSTFALYCKDCDEYYIRSNDYENLKRHHPIMVLRVIPTKKSGTEFESSRFEGYAVESVLRQCGYTVSQSENLSPRQRRIILELVIDGGILTHQQVVGHLEWNIEKDGTERNSLAREKWRDDINFLYEVYYHDAREVGIRSVRYR